MEDMQDSFVLKVSETLNQIVSCGSVSALKEGTLLRE